MAGVAVRVRDVFAGYDFEQPVEAGTPLVMVQLMTGVRPAWLCTRPLPPVGVLVMLMVKGPFRNCAVTVRAPDILNLHSAVPLHGLPQPTNELPVVYLAVRVIAVPWLKEWLQPVAAALPAVMVQLIPTGLEVTLPLPVPLPTMVSP